MVADTDRLLEFCRLCGVPARIFKGGNLTETEALQLLRAREERDERFRRFYAAQIIPPYLFKAGLIPEADWPIEVRDAN